MKCMKLAKDGYPTETALKYIENYNFIKKPVKPFIEALEELWWMSSWGFEIVDVQDDFKSVTCLADNPRYHWNKRIYLSTGGWSGNEDLINALKNNKWFWSFFWVQSRRGGHYVFEISFNVWNKNGKVQGGQKK